MKAGLMESCQYTVEFIEESQYLLLTEVGQLTFADAEEAIREVLKRLDTVDRITHFIVDMSRVVILPGSEAVIDSEIIKKLHDHPRLGIQAMVVPPKEKDPLVHTALARYERKLIGEKVLAKNLQFRRHIAQFPSLEEAITFLRIYDKTWDDRK